MFPDPDSRPCSPNTIHFITVLQIVLKYLYHGDPDCLPEAYEILRDFTGEKHYSEYVVPNHPGEFNAIRLADGRSK